MNWDDLRLLLQVSRNPKLNEAAVRLGQDATTISRRLRRLESDLGLTLFERTRRGHVLTPDGLEIARRAEELEQSAFDITNYADAGDVQAAGRVRLGVTEGLGASLIAPALAVFAEKHPQIEIDLIAQSGFVSVPKREADMSIMLARPQTGRLKVLKLSDYSISMYAARSYLNDRPVIRTVDDLKKHKLIGYVDELIYSPALRYYDEVLPNLAPSLCSSSIVAQLAMTRAGAGVAMLPRFMAHELPDLVQILPDRVRVDRSFWLATHEDMHQLARIRAVRDFLIQLFSANRVLLQQSD